MNHCQKLVVVAEDESITRMVASEALASAGFEVVEAANAEEALAIIAKQARLIQVLFTDIQMPGSMNGLALAKYTHDHWPWISVLVTSGAEQPTEAQMPECSRFLAKPYKLEQVLTNIRELADAH